MMTKDDMNNNKHKKLVVFDFDYTMTDCNSDSYFVELIGEPSIQQFMYQSYVENKFPSWTKLVENVLEKMVLEQNVSVDDIRKAVRQSPFPTQMVFLLNLLKRTYDARIVIISDANDWIIEQVLQEHKVEHLVDKIYTHKCTFYSHHVHKREMFKLDHFTDKVDCKYYCRKNLCKGEIIQELVKEYKQSDQIIYVGDGENDYCAATCLRSNNRDCVLVREGFELHKLLEKLGTEKTDIRSQISIWKDYDHLVELFQKLLTGPSRL